MRKIEPFIVKHYSSDERPIIKGNGFDGLQIGEDREEAGEFIAFVNRLISENALMKLKEGGPCNHAGCLSPVSHPCEGCGRVGGGSE